MPHYIIMPEGLTWQEIDRPQTKLNVIYNLESAFINPKTRTAIYCRETVEIKIFSRELDGAGNLLRVIEHDLTPAAIPEKEKNDILNNCPFEDAEPAKLTGEYIYFFDCLDAALCDKYLTLAELAPIIGKEPGDITERDLIKHAANYEATLYRYEKTASGYLQNEVVLYDTEF